MAFSCVKVQFEFGHEATLKNKRSPEGFTHDWEVFVRGADNSDISHFVDKVVFNLHDTFPKPKRVVKEPPYVVKESGYAGFELPIDIYFKNQNEPKKYQFKYDLILHSQTGQRGPVSKVLREKYVFNNPTEDLRRRLIRGGGVGVTGSSLEKLALAEDAAKQSAAPFVSKPKLSGDISKKQKVKDYKIDEPSRANDHFTDLFGTPIHTTRASPETKKASVTSTKNIEKVNNDKLSSGGKSSKHIPHKENSAKDEHRKDRDKSKEKSTKRSSSPPKRPASPNKHIQSPKRSVTPSKKASPKRPVTPTLKEENKKSSDDLRGKTDIKSAEGKTEKKKKDKKSKDDKSKKDRKSSDKKALDAFERLERAKDVKDKEKKLPKEHASSVGKEPDKIKAKHSEVEKDKEKQKHKHKKKDKNKQEDSNSSGKDKKKDKVRPSKKDSEKINDLNDKDQNGFEKESSRSSSHSSTNKKTDRNDSPSPVRPKASPAKRAVTPDKPSTSKEKPAKHPLKMLLEQLTDHEESSNSNNSLSEEEDTRPPPKKPCKSSEATSISSAAKTSQSIENVVNSYSYSPPNNKLSPSKPKAPFQESTSTNQNGKQRDKNEARTKKNGDEVGEKSGNKDESTDGKSLKRKRSSGKETKSKNKPPEKMTKEMPDVTSETVKLADEVPVVRNEKQTLVVKGVPRPIDLLKPHIVDGKFTADYVDQLKNLQHKIMTLDDNEELQRVVQVIAETGQYEITPKTFDFDLCTLDLVTVKRLQDFFTAS